MYVHKKLEEMEWNELRFCSADHGFGAMKDEILILSMAN